MNHPDPLPATFRVGARAEPPPWVLHKQSARRRRRLGRWLVALAVVVAAGGLGSVDYWVGKYQQRLIERKKERRAQLEKLGWYALRADILDVRYTSDGRYQATFWLENVFPENDFHVMVSAVKTYVQVGPAWKEVPTAEIPGGRLSDGTAVSLKEKVITDRVFDANAKDYFELLPGFMHVWFTSTMYIADSPEPRDDVVERTDNYYIHLKPIGAKDEDIRRLNSFPGGVVPIFITMPPH